MAVHTDDSNVSQILPVCTSEGLNLKLEEYLICSLHQNCITLATHSVMSKLTNKNCIHNTEHREESILGIKRMRKLHKIIHFSS